MSKKINVQVSFTEREMDEVKILANDEGFSVSQFLKHKVLSDSEFSKSFEELKKKVKNMTVGTEFSLKLVFGTDWLQISKGTKLSMGRAFFSQVKQRLITNVEIGIKDSSHTQLYKKI